MIELGFHEPLDTRQIVYRHLVHPRPTLWHSLIVHLSTLCARYLGHSVDLVSADQWVNKVRDAASRPGDTVNVKAVKLVGLWASKALAAQARPTREVLDIPRLETQVTESESPALRNCEATGESDVDKWFSYWIRRDLFTAP
jgi:hypothetical protein